MHKVVRESEAAVRSVGLNKSVTNIITKAISPGVSLATTQATDFTGTETTPYDRIYYVLEGELTLVFDGQTQTLQPGDACFIAKGTTYQMSGTFKAVVVNQPAFGAP